MTLAEFLAGARRAAARLGPTGGLDAVLGVVAAVRVRPDPRVPTAQVQREGAGFVMSVSPSFCAAQVLDDDDALALLLHELLHVLRGHLDLPPPARGGHGVWNLALDMLVNGQIVGRLMPDGCGMFRRLYPSESLPCVLLLPPRDLFAALAAADPTAARLATRTHASLGTLDALDRTAATASVADHFARLGARGPEALARLYLDGWLDIPEASGWVLRAAETLAHSLPEAVTAHANRHPSAHENQSTVARVTAA